MAHDRREVELWTRELGGPWHRALAAAGAELELAAIGATLSVDAIYDDAQEPK